MTSPISQPTPIAILVALALLTIACQGGNAPSSVSDWGSDSSPSPRVDTTQMPADHTADWLQRHGALAMGSGNDCAVCHSEQDCVSCHVDSLDAPYAVHPPNYETVHATDARQGVMDCASCHRLDTFCETCHIESGVTPRLDDRPPASLDFHPPEWIQTHGDMARQDINDCASCHMEQDCVACHRGINPHPPDFQLNCAHTLDADPSSCAQCHTEDLQTLQQLCL